MDGFAGLDKVYNHIKHGSGQSCWQRLADVVGCVQ
jgi:hypothetical protein